MTRQMVLAACCAVLALAAAGCTSSAPPEPGKVETVHLGGDVELAMVWIPGGTFAMGSPEDEPERDDCESLHEVEISGFWMGQFEVTQAQYEHLVGTNPSQFKRSRNPVNLVSWEDATEFCRRLSKRTGRKYSLPTEAQWEYACRAGTQTTFYTGDTLSTDQANFDGRQGYGVGEPGVFRARAIPVGSFPPNAFGLYDMHGNVFEWCKDWFHQTYYTSCPRRDPPGPSEGSAGREVDKILRGGCYAADGAHCRSAERGCGHMKTGDPGWGIRVVCTSRDPVGRARRSAKEAPSKTASRVSQGPESGDDFTQDLGSGVALDMIWIPGGKFDLGSRFDEVGRLSDENPVYSFSVNPFWLAKHETTVAQFRRFVEETGYQTEAEKAGKSVGTTTPAGAWVDQPGLNWRNPGFAQTDRDPVVHVTWNDASAFCSWLSGKTGLNFRLPMESEWEHACRVGTDASYQWGDEPAEGAGWLNAADAAAQKAFPDWTVFPFDDGFVYTAPVGSFSSNAFGLYDMLGNVWEWCFSVYYESGYRDADAKFDQKTATGPRVFRGGSWAKEPTRCRIAFRGSADPASCDANIGFRAAASAAQPAK